MKHGGVKVVHAHRVLLGRIAEFIGSAVTDPSLHAAGNQERKPLDATIASVATLRHRRAAKLPAPPPNKKKTPPRCADRVGRHPATSACGQTPRPRSPASPRSCRAASGR